MNKKFMRGFAALAVMLSITAPAAYAAGNDTGFADVGASAWYAEAAVYCRDLGLMAGENGAFAPDKPMTRAELAWALYQLAGAPASAGAPFSDVDDTAPYAPAVRWAAAEGVVDGYTDGRFGPGDPLTREQMAAVLWRREGSPASARGLDYADEANISGFASAAVDWARAKGIMSGLDGYRFDPQGGLTRAQAAMVLMNYAREDYVLTEAAALEADCAPRGMAAMADGSLLIADAYNKVLWRVKDGVSTVYAGDLSAADPYGQPMGGYNDAGLTDSIFRSPWAIAPFLDGWAVSDTANRAIRLVGDRQVQTINARPAEEDLPAGEDGVTFVYPTGLASDGEGNLYVADTHRGVIVKITPEGAASVCASGLEDPMGLCWRDGALYAAETGANRIVRIADGQVAVAAGSGEAALVNGAAAQAAFCEPQAVAVGEDGAIYVADTGNSAIRRVKDGVVTTLAVRDAGDLDTSYPISPTALLMQGDTLYICDSFSRKLLSLTIR